MQENLEEKVKTATMSEARQHLPALADEVVRTGVTVLITRRGQPVAKLVSAAPHISDDVPPLPLRGLPLELSEDFDEPLEELWEALGR
jgi:prevent-host-death family protein